VRYFGALRCKVRRESVAAPFRYSRTVGDVPGRCDCFATGLVAWSLTVLLDRRRGWLGGFAAVEAGDHVESEQSAFEGAVEEWRFAGFFQA
jgi:hypothetical protein